MNPATFHLDVRLLDGRIAHIRAIRPSDREALLREFHRLDSSSVRNRFFTSKHELSATELTFFTDVDFVRHVALVAEVCDNSGPRAAGVARFVLTDQPGHAELAVTVAQDLHGLGIGTALLDQLVNIARAEGLQYLEAYVLQSNKGMLDVLWHCGLPVQVTTDQGMKILTLELNSTAHTNTATCEQ